MFNCSYSCSKQNSFYLQKVCFWRLSQLPPGGEDIREGDIKIGDQPILLKALGHFHNWREKILLMYSNTHLLTWDGGFLSQFLCEPQQDTVFRSAPPSCMKPKHRPVSPGSLKIYFVKYSINREFKKILNLNWVPQLGLGECRLGKKKNG